MPVKPFPNFGWNLCEVSPTITLVDLQERQAIGARLRAYMDQEHLTNVTMAVRAGVSDKTISHLLNCKLDPQSATIRKIAETMGIDEHELRGIRPHVTVDGHAPDLFARFDALETALARIEGQLQELSDQQGLLTAVDRELLREFQALLDRLGRDIGRGRPRSRGGREIPPPTAKPAV